MKTCSLYRLVLPAVFSLTLGVLAGPIFAQTTMKIGMGTINDQQHEFAKQFAARMEKQAPGKLKIEVYPAEQLGTQSRLMEGLTLGTVEGLIAPPEFMVGLDPRFQIMGAPGVVQDMEHAARLTADARFRDALFNFAESKGVKGIGLIAYGPNSYATRKPVRTVADFKGMKIRVFGSPMHTVAMERLGATGVPMNPGDALQALGSGAIDGNRTGITLLVAFKYFDIVKSATQVDGDAMIYSMFAVGKRWFDGLPADTQKMVLESAVAVEPFVTKMSLDLNKKAEADWRERGADFIRFTGAERAEFIKRMQAAGDEVVVKNPRIKEAYNLMVERAKATRK